MENNQTGLLLHKKDIERHRKWFKDMTKMLGINVVYRAPRKSKTWDMYGELDANYCEPIVIGCIFEEHTDQKTMKMMGWNAERGETTPTIQVPYDVPDLQAGALFIIPSGFDKTEGRVFRVLDMHASPVYPAAIACILGPVFKNETPKAEITDFTHSDFNVLKQEEE